MLSIWSYVYIYEPLRCIQDSTVNRRVKHLNPVMYQSVCQYIALFVFSTSVYYCRNNSDVEDKIEISNLICEVSLTFFLFIKFEYFLTHFRPIFRSYTPSLYLLFSDVFRVYKNESLTLTFSWRMSLSYRNQPFDLLWKYMLDTSVMKELNGLN